MKETIPGFGNPRPEAPELENEPVLVVKGFSGSGKTTVIEGVIPRLTDDGLSVGVVKDSDRLFRAGAELILCDPSEMACRSLPGSPPRLIEAIRELLSRHDIVLVEGHHEATLPTIRLCDRHGMAPPAAAGEKLLGVLPWDSDRIGTMARLAHELVVHTFQARPIFGGLLVGGSSRRMGRPKQLLEIGGRSLAGTITETLRPHVDRTVLLGSGKVPASLGGLERLPDPPGIKGPLAGILAALRWAPRVTWIILPCDLVAAVPEAVAWLLGERDPGHRGIFPRLAGGFVEPLFSVWEPHAARSAEAMATGGGRSPWRLASLPGFATPSPPSELAGAWQDINSPENFREIRQKDAPLDRPGRKEQ